MIYVCQVEFAVDTSQARSARVALDWNSKKAGVLYLVRG